ncbi:MAG: rhodanese-like domain-containing protein [Bacteroidota bacterium]|nr:rhodanese-like domain-containing protein [Bacteroidota bacterium]
MEIKQFYDSNLAHASYAVLSENEIALIDPARDPKQYYDFAKENKAKIVAVIETHPHADFVSSHLEISKTTGAKIYVSKLVNPDYEFIAFDEGDVLKLGAIILEPMNTPGHSPDSICVLIRDEKGKDYAIATGDTLFVGDVGRPDLRESAGSINKSKQELARMMFNTITKKLINLPDSTLVFPAHGAGSLCGKSTSKETSSTIGKEKKENYALQPMSENEFVYELLKDQSFVPKYFSYNVGMNRTGAPDFEESIKNVKRIDSYDDIKKDFAIVDTRSKEDFMKSHHDGAINIRDETKFETWLGAIISPEEKFYLISDFKESLERVIHRAAKIGYELNIKGALIHHETPNLKKSEVIDPVTLKKNSDCYTIVDVRNKSEVEKKKIFKKSIWIPLNEVRERFKEIPVDKPVVVHCAAGFRSAAASSILENLLDTKVYDLSDNIKLFSDN